MSHWGLVCIKILLRVLWVTILHRDRYKTGQKIEVQKVSEPLMVSQEPFQNGRTDVMTDRQSVRGTDWQADSLRVRQLEDYRARSYAAYTRHRSLLVGRKNNWLPTDRPDGRTSTQPQIKRTHMPLQDRLKVLTARLQRTKGKERREDGNGKKGVYLWRSKMFFLGNKLNPEVRCSRDLWSDNNTQLISM